MRLTARHLFLLASLAVAALVLVSDPSPPCADLASAQTSLTPVSTVCQVLEVLEGRNGWTLTLADMNGGRASAFLPQSVGRAPPVGTIIELVLEASDRVGFFFVRDMSDVAPTHPAADPQSKRV